MNDIFPTKSARTDIPQVKAEMPKLSEVAARIVNDRAEEIVPKLVEQHTQGLKESLFAELLDRINTDDLVDQVAERNRPRFNVFGGLAQVGRIDSSAADFVPSGTGAITRTVQDALRDFVSDADYTTSGNYDTARAALTARIGAYALDLRNGDNLNMFSGTGTPTTGQVIYARIGTSASPDTTLNPGVKVARTIEVAFSSFGGGDGAEQMAAIQGIGNGTAANEAQPVGVYGAATSNYNSTGSGKGDACGLVGIGRFSGTGAGTGIGASLAGRRDVSTGRATAAEFTTLNYSGVAGSYNSTGYSNTTGEWVVANGDADSGVGIVVGNPYGFQFKVGIAFNAQVIGGKTGGVADSSIRDDSTATTSLDIRGTHTTALSIASGAGAVSIANNVVTIARAAGTVATGTVLVHGWSTSFTGDSGGATDFRANQISAQNTGGNAVNIMRPLRVFSQHSGSATVTTQIGLTSAVRLDSTGSTTGAQAVEANITLASAANVTTGDCFAASAPSLSSTGAITTHRGFVSSDLGHATLVTNAIGHDAANMTAAATLTVGFRSQMTSGTGKWGFYASGTAQNGFVGKTIFGTVSTTPVSALHIQDATTGWIVQDELDANPTTTELDASDSVAIYNKANKFVIAYNLAGTINYLVATLDGSTATWTNSTSAP